MSMQIKKETTGEQAFAKLSALCARSEHCQHEMLEKMRQWGVDDKEQAEVMAKLIAGHYVDDERFARAFVGDKIRYDKWGRRKVEQALWQKHIDKDIVARVLGEIGDEEYVEVLKSVLKQKRKSTKAGSEYELTMKLIKYALGRGFTMDIIRQCIGAEYDYEFLD